VLILSCDDKNKFIFGQPCSSKFVRSNDLYHRNNNPLIPDHNFAGLD